MSLFRKEAQQAQTAQWLGVVRISRPLGFSLIAGLAVGIVSLLIAFAAWGDVNRKTRVSGLLVSSMGSLNIAAPLAGVLVESNMVEGKSVQAGDVLLVLNTERNSTAGETSTLTLLHIEARKQTLHTERGLRQMQSNQRRQVLNDRIQTLQAELLRLDEEQQLLANRVQLTQKTLARHQQLAGDGFVSQAQVQTTQEELIELNSRQQAQARLKLSTARDLRTLSGEAEGITTQLEADLNQLDRNLASLNQELAEASARKSTVITAPFAGRVSAYNMQLGQSVQIGQHLATLVRTPNADLEAQLYAPSRTVGFLKSGQPVYMRYAAYPYQKFGLQTGQITAISTTPFAASELPPNLAQQLIAQAGSNEALFRINVRLDKQTITSYGEPLQLKAGLTLDADVLQERRKIWEWVLEPLLAAKANLKVLNANPNPNRGGAGV